jgi:hypothetical protein
MTPSSPHNVSPSTVDTERAPTPLSLKPFLQSVQDGTPIMPKSNRRKGAGDGLPSTGLPSTCIHRSRRPVRASLPQAARRCLTARRSIVPSAQGGAHLPTDVTGACTHRNFHFPHDLLITSSSHTTASACLLLCTSRMSRHHATSDEPPGPPLSCLPARHGCARTSHGSSPSAPSSRRVGRATRPASSTVVVVVVVERSGPPRLRQPASP